MTASLHPNTELVAVAWLRSIPGVTQAGTTLPDAEKWAASGFVQVVGVGGFSDPYVPMIAPSVGITCWAANLDSGSPPWGKAAHLAESIRWACYRLGNTSPAVPVSYAGARLMSAFLLSEPRRVSSEPTSYARYDFDLGLRWTES
jgi:hypothetical protein